MSTIREDSTEIMPPLQNKKREKFCREYMEGKNATQAYMTAYPYAEKDSAIKSA